MSQDYVSGAKSDYTKGALNRMMLNWPEMEAAYTEPAILYKWDIEMAIECLNDEERKSVFTVLAFGDSAFNSGAVSVMEWDKILERMYSVLNKEGLVRKNNQAEVLLATDKGRPFTVLEMAQQRGEVG